MLTLERIKSVVARLSEKYGVKRAYLFGSYARGEATEDSDVDILIEKGNLTKYKDYAKFYFELRDSLEKDVDLQTDKGVHPKMMKLIDQDRIMLYGAA